MITVRITIDGKANTYYWPLTATIKDSMDAVTSGVVGSIEILSVQYNR